MVPDIDGLPPLDGSDALRYHRQIILPEIGEDDGLLAVERVGVYGSDPPIYSGRKTRGERPYPIIIGHEIVGRIVKIGKKASQRLGVKEGDRAAMEYAARALLATEGVDTRESRQIEHEFRKRFYESGRIFEGVGYYFLDHDDVDMDDEWGYFPLLAVEVGFQKFSLMAEARCILAETDVDDGTDSGEADAEGLVGGNPRSCQAQLRGSPPSHDTPQQIAGAHIRPSEPYVDVLGTEHGVFAGQPDVRCQSERQAYPHGGAMHGSDDGLGTGTHHPDQG